MEEDARQPISLFLSLLCLVHLGQQGDFTERKRNDKNEDIHDYLRQRKAGLSCHFPLSHGHVLESNRRREVEGEEDDNVNIHDGKQR